MTYKENSMCKAYKIAKEAHKGQVDKAGVDYINHPVAVASMLETEEEKIVALLHDVIEDTSVTLEYLYEQGFSENIVKAVDAITKRDNERLEDYIIRVKNNELAKNVKLADLSHNSDLSRINNPTENDYKRLERYKKETEFLKGKKDIFTL